MTRHFISTQKENAENLGYYQAILCEDNQGHQSEAKDTFFFKRVIKDLLNIVVVTFIIQKLTVTIHQYITPIANHQTSGIQKLQHSVIFINVCLELRQKLTSFKKISKIISLSNILGKLKILKKTFFCVFNMFYFNINYIK